jgi:hypothetical protein
VQTRHAAPMRGFCIIERGVIHNAGAHERFRASHNPGDLLTDNDLKTERATEPPKRWVNWWRAEERAYDPTTGDTFEPGEEYADENVWPSKDTAETDAAAALRLPRDVYMLVTYLGAFPDGETP